MYMSIVMGYESRTNPWMMELGPVWPCGMLARTMEGPTSHLYAPVVFCYCVCFLFFGPIDSFYVTTSDNNHAGSIPSMISYIS